MLIFSELLVEIEQKRVHFRFHFEITDTGTDRSSYAGGATIPYENV